MDFRAMLKKKKYAKWKKEEEKIDVNLKEVEKDTKPQLKKVEKVGYKSYFLFKGNFSG